MIEDFSSGYYYTRMSVQKYEDGPVIQRDLYDFIDSELYVDSNAPVTMRVGLDAGEMFEVGAEGAIPRDVLAVPDTMVDEYGIESVFIVKSKYLDAVGDYDG